MRVIEEHYLSLGLKCIWPDLASVKLSKTFGNAHLVWPGPGLSGSGTAGQTGSRREVAAAGEAGNKEKSLAMRETHFKTQDRRCSEK